jgi:hypothetical protein
MDLWQIVNLRIMQNKVLWRTLALTFCALVFFFALHAKTAVYEGSAAKITPSTASKLWESGQKLEPHTLQSSTGSVLFWMAVICLFTLCFHNERLAQSAFVVPAPSHRPLRHLHRFLRPPPLQN